MTTSHHIVVMWIAKHQPTAGRYFLPEHPLCAAKWADQELHEVRGVPDMQRVNTEVCMAATKSREEHGSAQCRTPTGFMTLARKPTGQLTQKFGGTHGLALRLDGRATLAEVYQAKLCAAIPRGVVEQSIHGGKCDDRSSVFAVRGEPPEHVQFVDAVTRLPLEPVPGSQSQSYRHATFKRPRGLCKHPNGATAGRNRKGAKWVGVTRQ